MSEPLHNLPSAEDLDAAAEEQRITEETATKVNTSVCIACGGSATRICIHCGQDFCSKHFCSSHETSTKIEPLTDEDGEAHQGRRIRLIGEGWPNALLVLDNLSDDELTEYIKGMQKLLEQAIQTGNYASISIAAAEYKLSYRQHSRHVAAVKRREKLEKQGQIHLNSKKRSLGTKPQIPQDIAMLMQLGKLSYEEALKVKEALKTRK